MVNFSLSKSVAVVGERIEATCSEIDTSKGYYVCVVSNYNNSFDDYTLAQQQNILGTGNHPTPGSIVGQSMRVYITSENYDKINSLTIFYFNYYNNTNYSDVNDFENRVTLGDYTQKSQTFDVSLYDGKNLTGIISWLRQWFPNKEEIDTLFLTDSGWQSCTISGGYSIYTSGQIVRVRKIGRVVEFSGIVKPNSQKGTTGEYQIATIPSGYRPIRDQTKICQGSNMDRWLLVVKTTGAVTASRYGTTSYTAQPNNAWLNFVITYMID